MSGHGFDRTKYTLHSTKYTVQITQYTIHITPYTVHFAKLHSKQYRASGIPSFTRCAIQEMGSSADGELRRWGVHDKMSPGVRAYTRWGVHEKRSSGDGKFTRWEIKELGFARWGL